MNKKTNEELQSLVMKATSGDKEALEMLVTGVQDIIFNLSLRMLGTFADAEDATQDILLKMITHLSSFRGDSSFTTWVFSIAVNHLKNYKKHMFAHYPLSFEYYGEDIQNGKIQDVPDLTQNVEKDILAEELKMSCTNVMLQCLDTESRCIFILGTMFKVDSRIAGDILGMTPEAYRQRLSRIRKKMADFLGQYCGNTVVESANAKDRVNYANTKPAGSTRYSWINVAATEIPCKERCSCEKVLWKIMDDRHKELFVLTSLNRSPDNATKAC